MSNEQLVMLYQHNNKDAIQQLYQQNSGLINRVISRFPGYDREDLRQEAFFGIERAAREWNEDAGSTFAGYAYVWIFKFMVDYVRSMGGSIRLPSGARARIRLYNKTVNDLSVTLGRDPTRSEIAKAMAISENEIDMIRADMMVQQIKSLSDPVPGIDDQITLEGTIADPADPMEKVLDQMQNEQLAAELWPLVDQLGEREAAVIRSRYQDGVTFGEIGRRLGISENQARNLSVTAHRHLRSSRNVKRLRPYYDIYAMATRGSVSSFLRSWTSATERTALKLMDDATERPKYADMR